MALDYVVPRNVSERARDIARSYQEYRQLASMKQPIKNGYILTLALITLVVIFSATWFGFQQAKSITIPLQRLAEGTREVAQGNWSYRIEAGGDEETAVLVDSFNQMTADLQQINSELVERRKYVENILANIAAGVVSLSQKRLGHHAQPRRRRHARRAPGAGARQALVGGLRRAAPAQGRRGDQRGAGRAAARGRASRSS